MQMTHRSTNCGHNQQHRTLHFECKDMDVPHKLQMNDDKIEAIIFARKGLATEHLPK